MPVVPVLLALVVAMAGCGAPDGRYGISAYERGNYALARSFWTPLALQGNPEAQYYLGAMSAGGRGGPRDDVAAGRWFRKAAEQGHAESQYELGVLYAAGRGVPTNGDKAVSWWRKAAAQGHVDAMYDLGLAYERGTGVPLDAREAAKWYRMAADLGHHQAQLKWTAVTTGDPEPSPRKTSDTDVDASCPYYRFYPDFWAVGGSAESLELSKTVLYAFANALDGYSFTMTSRVDDAYWRATALVSHAGADRSAAHGLINMRAFAGFEGGAMPYGHETLAGTLEYGLVFEHPVSDVEFFARKSAEAFVDELLPHAREKCDDWRTGALREEARLRRIQKQLADEIDRLRRNRVDGAQGRRLELEVDEPPEGLLPGTEEYEGSEPDRGSDLEPEPTR